VVSLLAGELAFGALRPIHRSTNHFLIFDADNRVRYEPGAEQLAATVAQFLPDALAMIEQAQFRPFAKPVTIYVCASTATFERYGYGVAGAGGFVLRGRLFVSPKPQNTAERLPRLLTHELSHLHLEQRLGMVRFARNVPAWFREGLAVHVAGGGGAETVSESEAREAIAQGRVFRRDRRGHLFFRQTPARDGLNAHLFYRQAAMFVAFMSGRQPAAFERLLNEIMEQQDFNASVQRAYGCDVEALWTEFIEGNRARRS
jgi:hypothetical protein